jgi:hypothetical protein
MGSPPLLVIGRGDGVIKVFDLASKKLLNQIELADISTEDWLDPIGIGALALDETGTQLAIACVGPAAYSLSVITGFEDSASKVKRVILDRGSDGPIRQIAFLDERRLLASGEFVKVWNLKSNRLTEQILELDSTPVELKHSFFNLLVNFENHHRCISLTRSGLRSFWSLTDQLRTD